MTNEPLSSINKQWKQMGREANLTAQKILESTYGLFQITTQKVPSDLRKVSDYLDKQMQVCSTKHQGPHSSSISRSLLEVMSLLEIMYIKSYWD